MSIEQIQKELQKTYGESALFNFADVEARPPDVISSGSLTLDHLVLGVGGFPRGRVTELAGGEGSGKTTICLHAGTNALKQGLYVAYIDAERKLDMRYARSLGLDKDNDRLFVSKPHTAEQALDITDALCKSPEVGLIILDSVPALGSLEEKEKDYVDNSSFGAVARLLNKFFRRSIDHIEDNNIAVIFVNQYRSDIAKSRFIPNAKKTSGGRGLQYYSSVLLRLRVMGKIGTTDHKIAHEVKAVAEKNGVAPPYRAGTFKIWYGIGIDPYSELLDIGEELGIIKKSGSYYKYQGNVIAQGFENSMNALKEDTELYNLIKEEVTECLKHR